MGINFVARHPIDTCQEIGRRILPVNHSHHATKYRFEQALGDLTVIIDAGATEIYISLADQDYTLAGSKKGQGVNDINYPKGLVICQVSNYFVCY